VNSRRQRLRGPIRFFFDEETQTWHFTADNPGVTGGGDATLDEARQHAADALWFALGDDDQAAEEVERFMGLRLRRDGAWRREAPA
jgi:hypothetical protein